MIKGIVFALFLLQLSGCKFDSFIGEHVERQSKVGELSRELFVECMKLLSKIARQDSMNEISTVIMACSEQANNIADQTVR